MSKKIPTKIPEEIREYLYYDENVGSVTWIKKPSKGVSLGSVAGCINKKTGYCVLRFNKSLYQAHRIVWFLKTGKQPEKDIDHKDGNKLNNCWTNLREATHNQNEHNKTKYSNNTSGFKGVYRHTKNNSWIARIWVNSKVVHLGSFGTPEEAYKAYCEAAKSLHGDFANF